MKPESEGKGELVDINFRSKKAIQRQNLDPKQLKMTCLDVLH
jgi:hypothetical protein